MSALEYFDTPVSVKASPVACPSRDTRYVVQHHPQKHRDGCINAKKSMINTMPKQRGYVRNPTGLSQLGDQANKKLV